MRLIMFALVPGLRLNNAAAGSGSGAAAAPVASSVQMTMAFYSSTGPATKRDAAAEGAAGPRLCRRALQRPALPASWLGHRRRSSSWAAAVNPADGDGPGAGEEASSSPAPASTCAWSSLTVAKLREELKARGLPSSGNKAELVARLQAHQRRLERESAAAEPTASAEKLDGASSLKSRRRGQSVRTAAQLREELGSRGLPTGGTKRELVARLAGLDAGEGGGAAGGGAAPMAPNDTLSVAALRALLRSRGMPVSGRKAKLISRLEASDRSASSRKTSSSSGTKETELPPEATTRSKYMSDLIVVLDMDQCLIDSHVSYEEESSENFIERLLSTNWQRKAWINQDLEHWRFQVTDNVEAYVTPRPGVREFLRNVTSRFEAHVFTSADERYAGKVLDLLDPEGSMLAGRWYRPYTVSLGNSRIKDLTLLFPDRDLGRIVLVDDWKGCMLANPANGIPIPAYMGLDPNDDELAKVWSLLLELDGVPDVRPILDEKFGVAKEWESYLENNGEEIDRLLRWKRQELRRMEEEEGKAPKK